MKSKLSVHNISILILMVLLLSKFSTLHNESENKTVSISNTSPYSGDTLFQGFQNYVCAPNWQDSATFWNVTNHLDSYKELNYTGAHMWISDCDSLGLFKDDSLRPDQKNRLERIINDASQMGLTSVFERVNISNLCFSQRLIYENGINSGVQNRSINYGFAFEDNMNVQIMDEGRSVLHPVAGENPEGWLCGSIYENLQHSDLYYWYPGTTDTTDFWHLKPVMKINTNDFSPFDTTAVVAVVTKNFIGKTIDSTIIRIQSFRDNTLQYNGEYILDYFVTGNALQVLGNLQDSLSINYGRENDTIDLKEDCKVDFKVYWFGLVDVWFDKMIVDDERADILFKGTHDYKIENEVDLLHDKMVFFIDELVSSQAHTTKYVIDKMKIRQPDCKIEFSLSNNLNMHSHRNNQTRSRMLFDIIRPDIVCLDDHVFLMDDYHEIYRVYLPDNAVKYHDYVPESWKKSPQEYNDRLQNIAFGNKDLLGPFYQGTFIYQIYNIRNDLREFAPNAKFMVQPQLHSWTKTDTLIGKFDFGGFREPINEEIQAEAMIALSHGAQSFNWVNYHSLQTNNINRPIKDAQIDLYTNLGLRNDSHLGYSKRDSNIISQNKWEYVKAMNLKILHWKPTLDQIKWDNGYSVHHENADHKYISDIKSIIVHSEAATSCYSDNTNYDCPEDRYWEMGFFDPDFTNPLVSSNDKSKYFIMVNRRCVPEVNEDGDLRQLKIKFDSTQLSDFRNWKIIELDSNKVVTTFDKNSGNYVDMGIFQPGEGRLYKLVPVMQEGGTLIADESINGVTFDCIGDVDNNEKDISIYVGTNINFANDVRWNVDGGEFK